MNKAIKYIWVVETENIHSDGKSGGKSQSFFSTEGKAKSYVEWCMSCADKSDARLMEHDKDGWSAKYMLSNGDTWIIDTKRKALDLD